MPNIIDNTWFKFDLAIPNAIELPSITTDTVNDVESLTDFITMSEKSLLIKALGLSVYNQLQTALEDLPNADQKWKDLVNGKEYNDKLWEGLGSPKSLIAYYIYAEYLSDNSSFWSTLGVEKPQAENSQNATPFYKIASSWQTFIKKYQGNACNLPNFYINDGISIVDYYGDDNETEVSLYRYLMDNKDLYGWDESKFKVYEQKNSFGL